MANRLVTGIVKKPHGVRGVLKVCSASGEYEHFPRLRELTLRSAGQEKRFAVEDCRLTADGALLKLAGIDSPEAAAAYRGWEILVPRSQASPLAEGQYYEADLCGCALISGGVEKGKVRSVLDTGAHQSLEVVDGAGATWFIPFVEAHVGEVNIAERRIELKSEWLLA
jgi:16S rRNA processing protein RimM